VEVRKNVKGQCVGHLPDQDTLRKGRLLSFPAGMHEGGQQLDSQWAHRSHENKVWGFKEANLGFSRRMSEWLEPRLRVRVGPWDGMKVL